MSPEFVDTNVLLYAHDPQAGHKASIALDLVRRLASERAGALSIQVLQEFYVNATKKLALPLSNSEAAQQVWLLSSWTVHAPRASDVVEAIRIATDNTISFWDAMIVRSASALGCGTLWTEDLNHGQQIEGVTIINPFAN
ncbi:MAG: PIN domain-containing protein [Bifidobacteriaceae bacterium]|nr:PIN domain-containing protein [Bifidobacteriaceae bacterium]